MGSGKPSSGGDESTSDRYELDTGKDESASVWDQSGTASAESAMWWSVQDQR